MTFNGITQFGGVGAGVGGNFRLARQYGFGTEGKFGGFSGRRIGQIAGNAAGFAGLLFKEVFNDAVFQRMKVTTAIRPSGRRVFKPLAKPFLQFAQLIVDRDSQSLKGTRGRIGLSRFLKMTLYMISASCRVVSIGCCCRASTILAAIWRDLRSSPN